MIMNYKGPRVVRRSRLEIARKYLLFSRIITYWSICSACISSSCNKCWNKSNAYLLIKFIFISHCMFKSNECVFFFPSLSLWKNIDQVAMSFLVPLRVKKSQRALTDKFVSPVSKANQTLNLILHSSLGCAIALSVSMCLSLLFLCTVFLLLLTFLPVAQNTVRSTVRERREVNGMGLGASAL